MLPALPGPPPNVALYPTTFQLAGTLLKSGGLDGVLAGGTADWPVEDADPEDGLPGDVVPELDWTGAGTGVGVGTKVVVPAPDAPLPGLEPVAWLELPALAALLLELEAAATMAAALWRAPVTIVFACRRARTVAREMIVLLAARADCRMAVACAWARAISWAPAAPLTVVWLFLVVCVLLDIFEAT